ncbi:MAG: GAF domain-containing protein [Pseudomonadota bacterium]
MASPLENALALVDEAGAAALAADGPESALRAIVQRCYDTLGDRDAHLRPDALKPGETQYFVAGAFMISPDGAYHMLVGNVNFPPDQERLMIPIAEGNPGWVVHNRSKLILANTDEHGDFRQYLKTSRMGSSIYAPLFWRGEIIGQLAVAAQARWTMRQADLDVLVACAHIASACWVAHGGPEWLNAIYPPDNAWRIDERRLDQV